jgi:hypothetical protein
MPTSPDETRPKAMSTTREKLLATTSKFVSTFGSFDVNEILAIRTPTCLYHQCCPSFNKNVVTNEETRTNFPQFIATFRRFDFSILEPDHTLVDEAARRVMIRAKASAESIVGAYENEYIFILKMTEDCGLVDEIYEFYDTIRLKDLQHRLEAKHISYGDAAPFETRTTTQL